MIFNNDFKAIKKVTYESTIKNLEKAQEILDDRYNKKQITDSEYIKRSKEINADIEKYRRLSEEGY